MRGTSWFRAYCAPVIFGTLMTVSISSCSHSPDSQEKSQVVATVNEHEITISQLNQILSQSNPQDPSAVSPAIKRQALDHLIDEELLVQKAIVAQLDRDPSVVRSIDEARRRILAQAYTQRNIVPKEDVSLSDRQQFYQANPLLFEQRKVYQLTSFTVGEGQVTPALKAELDATHTPDQVRDVLNRHQIKYVVDQVFRGSEDLPDEQRAQFAKLNAGDVAIESVPGRTFLVAVTNVANSPLDFQQANPRINQYLLVTRDRKALEDRIKEFRAVAKISYSEEGATADPPTSQDDYSATSPKGF